MLLKSTTSCNLLSTDSKCDQVAIFRQYLDIYENENFPID